MSTAERWQLFADTEASPSSPLYASLARGVAADQELLALCDRLPPAKRQPNLLLAVTRLLFGVPQTFEQMRDWLLAEPDRVLAECLQRSTQTNEPARCAALLTAMAQLQGPLALIEVGASAGLCLYPDRYSYVYGDVVVNEGSAVVIRSDLEGPVPVPHGVPEVAMRIGVDLNPLDLTNDDDLQWLDSLIWPEHEERRLRQQAAAAIVRLDPPTLLAGDLNEALEPALALVPDGATPVVFHSAVLNYLEPQARLAFEQRILELEVPWISQEAPGIVSAVLPNLKTLPDPARAVHLLSAGTRPLAYTAGHGGHIRWIDGI